MCFFTCSPRPPTLSQRHMDLHVWSYPRPDYIFRVSSEPQGVKIWPFPLLWLVAFTTACTTVQAVTSRDAEPTSTSRAIIHKRRISRVTFRSAHLYGNVYFLVGVARAGRFVPLWASGGAKFTKIGDSLPRTPINRLAKCAAASFLLGGEIRNPTNTI